jgi:two-component system sensor histidine kinase MprB
VTVRRRLVVLAAAAVAVAILLSSVVVYAVVRAELRGQVDDALRELVPDVLVRKAAVQGGAQFFSSQVLPAGASKAVVAVPPDPLGGATGVAQGVTAGGKVVAPAGAGPKLPVDARIVAVARGDRGAFFRDATVNGTHVRVYTAPGLAGEALQVARPLTEVDDALGRLVLVLAAVTLGGIGLAAGLGLLVARGTLAPVVRLTNAAEHVAGTHDLSRRLPVRERGDELDRLGSAFNTMLEALERSRVAQRQLVADASHELRTPLTSVRANVEALGRARDLPAEERDAIVASAGSQLEELTFLVGDLVDLARDDVPEIEREDLRLDTLVSAAVERARAHAGEHDIRLYADETLVHGSPARLHRAVSNLLDNAVKWSPQGGAIDVTVRDGRVMVRDHGPGFSEDDLAHVFERFYRAPGARGLPGSGLGLAIVRQTAAAHGGQVSARNAPDGGALLELALTERSPSS